VLGEGRIPSSAGQPRPVPRRYGGAELGVSEMGLASFGAGVFSPGAMAGHSGWKPSMARLAGRVFENGIGFVWKFLVFRGAGVGGLWRRRGTALWRVTTYGCPLHDKVRPGRNGWWETQGRWWERKCRLG
jgi:hypothetical protein